MNNKIKGIIFDYGGVISYPQNEDYLAKILRVLNVYDYESRKDEIEASIQLVKEINDIIKKKV